MGEASIKECVSDRVKRSVAKVYQCRVVSDGCFNIALLSVVEAPINQCFCGVIRRRMGKVYPAMRNVAFYLDAAKYWSVVDHIAPPYGTATLRDFFLKLRDREFPTGSFRERMKAEKALQFVYQNAVIQG